MMGKLSFINCAFEYVIVKGKSCCDSVAFLKGNSLDELIVQLILSIEKLILYVFCKDLEV